MPVSHWRVSITICYQCVIDAQSSTGVDFEGECYCCGTPVKPKHFLHRLIPQKAYLLKGNKGACAQCFRLALKHAEKFFRDNKDKLSNTRTPASDDSSRLFAFHIRK
jgi:hypothetical protein